ncbi:hypothetical protein EG68_09564 [Paragonimus skrjabini miyazakii]|uniref:Ubiquitin-like-conjugating enzyme ATG3 n=1 Tax=Paragonimus skrjabini miyazakii TaxID=59628 RepID=A0A8S9YI86_9TREM|nr:hypothetical protein EG68_09564 [Paragonimus skrjabini miyazakii]
MDSIRQAVARTALGLAEYVVPVLRTSKFKETGVITPEEFIAAGDFLVHHCPTWQWATGDKPPRNYLPPEKQYLLTRNVPCYKRVSQVDNHNEDLEKLVEDDDIEGGWVDTHHYATNYADETDKPTEMLMSANDSRLDVGPLIHSSNVAGDENDDVDDKEEDEEAEDMEAFVQRGMLDEIDPDTVNIHAPTLKDRGFVNPNTGPHDGILRTRTYDLYITYDKYYQTPRLWLYGYNEHRKPLTEDEMYEDFSQDHAKKTVTMEQHPHLSGPPMPSIHPCKQAEVMRKLIDAVADGGAELAVHQYIMVFLKFVQAVIPTIEYDYTRNFNMS